MKKVFLGLLMTGALFSCTSEKGYKIIGSVPKDMDNQMVYLEVPDESFDYNVIDSAKVVNGTFTFKGKESTPVIAAIKWGEGKRPITVVLQDGEIKVITEPVPMVTGTSLNDSLQFISAKDIRNDPYVDTFVENNKNNIVGAYVMSYIASGYSLEEIEKILSESSDEFKNSIYGKRIQKFAEGLKRSQIGVNYTNLTMKDPAGKEVSLSDYVGKGKYVLVDFWASWCGPCRREMPALVEAYAKYKDKGFEIVGVSLDTQTEAWEKSIEALNITWPQMSDLKGWESEATDIYGLAYIPQTLLIDPNGKIIAKNIYGEAVSEELAKYLK